MNLESKNFCLISCLQGSATGSLPLLQCAFALYKLTYSGGFSYDLYAGKLQICMFNSDLSSDHQTYVFNNFVWTINSDVLHVSSSTCSKMNQSLPIPHITHSSLLPTEQTTKLQQLHLLNISPVYFFLPIPYKGHHHCLTELFLLGILNWPPTCNFALLQSTLLTAIRMIFLKCILLHYYTQITQTMSWFKSSSGFSLPSELKNTLT